MIRDGTTLRIKHQAPHSFCAPERFHGTDPSVASDMWSFMCLFTNMYLGNPIFYGPEPGSTAFSWVQHLGAMPHQWKGMFWQPEQVNDACYDPTTISNPEADLSARIARVRPETSTAERTLALSVMHQGFRYLPEDHITAEQLLHDPDFIELMGMYQC